VCGFPAPAKLPYGAEVDLGSCLREPYDPTTAGRLVARNVHQGQRKLLLSEIQLLTEYYEKARGTPPASVRHPLVAYVGAAPGTHLAFLHVLFPHVRFVIYDGAPFDVAALQATPALREAFELRRQFFTDATCAEILARVAAASAARRPAGTAGTGTRATPLILISDIRSSPPPNQNPEGGVSRAAEFEAQVMRDMLAQRRWVEILQPDLSLLKFRLPYTMRPGDVVPYLGGKLLYGIWPPKESGEARLLVKRPDIARGDVPYDFQAYEQVMFFHNAYTRKACFAPNVPPEAAGLVDRYYCTCYDCVSELSVYARYLAKALPKMLGAAPTSAGAGAPAGIHALAEAAARSPAAAMELVVAMYRRHISEVRGRPMPLQQQLAHSVHSHSKTVTPQWASAARAAVEARIQTCKGLKRDAKAAKAAKAAE
jgi:cap3/cap4 methyltransferase